MKSYTIAKASGAPGWDAIEPLRADCVLWEPDCGVRMAQKLCYDDTALYVFQRAWESDIRAECSAPLSPVHEDSCMEFFFSEKNGPSMLRPMSRAQPSGAAFLSAAAVWYAASSTS